MIIGIVHKYCQKSKPEEDSEKTNRNKDNLQNVNSRKEKYVGRNFINYMKYDVSLKMNLIF